jgi:hypothetical protein
MTLYSIFDAALDLGGWAVSLSVCYIPDFVEWICAGLVYRYLFNERLRFFQITTRRSLNVDTAMVNA